MWHRHHREPPHTDTLLAEPQNHGCVTSPGDKRSTCHDSATSPLLLLKKQQGGKGRRAGLGSRVCRALSPWDLAFPRRVLGRWKVEDGGKTPAGLKPCEDGDAVTEHFVTGSQGKSFPVLQSLAAASFYLSFALRKTHTGFLSSLAQPAVAQGSAGLC